MPGFMQSLKSHLPQSPFSPVKSNPSQLPPVDLPEVGEESSNVAVQEASISEALPGEAMVLQGSSTVALTLTPANGQSTQQQEIFHENPDKICAEEPASQLDGLAKDDEESAQESNNQPQPTESLSLEVAESTPCTQEVTPPAPSEIASEAAQDVTTEGNTTECSSAKCAVSEASTVEPQEISAESSFQPEVPASLDHVVSQTDPESAAAWTESPEVDETHQQQTEEQLLPEVTSTHVEVPMQSATQEATSIDASVTDPITLTTALTPNADVGEKAENVNPAALSKSKSKKKFEFYPLKNGNPNPSPDANQDGLLSPKTRKNQLLADKFRHVIEQVKAKVKKEKQLKKVQESATNNVVKC